MLGSKLNYGRPVYLLLITGVLLLAGCTDNPVTRERISTEMPAIGTVETWAGSIMGYRNEKGEKARFNNPWGIAINSNGDLYIGDSDNALIRKVQRDQTVTTLAGRGWGSGYRDGAPDEALFAEPMGVELADNGVLYIADSFNHVIRSLTPGGGVGTFAGVGVPGSRDGKKEEALFNAPSDIAVASNLAMYITDGYNYKIRKIDTEGNVTTLAGAGVQGHEDGPAVIARFMLPVSIALGPEEENLYVADYFGHRIRRVRIESGTVTTIAGDGEPGFIDGDLQEARLNRPAGIAVGADRTIYFADSGNHTIRRIQDNRVTTLAGDGEPGRLNGIGNEARFNRPYHLVLSGSETFLYISDWQNHLVRRLRLR